jgi:hypothetical protein
MVKSLLLLHSLFFLILLRSSLYLIVYKSLITTAVRSGLSFSSSPTPYLRVYRCTKNVGLTALLFLFLAFDCSSRG